MPRCSRYGWQVSIPCKVKPNGGWQAVGADVLADSFTGGGWVARPPNPQTAALHHCHQVDHMTADPAVPRRDARGGVAGPDTARKIHRKTLATLPRGIGGKGTGAVQSMRSSGPQFHAITGQHLVDGDLLQTLEVGLWQWHGVRTASGI